MSKNHHHRHLNEKTAQAKPSIEDLESQIPKFRYIGDNLDGVEFMGVYFPRGEVVRITPELFDFPGDLAHCLKKLNINRYFEKVEGDPKSLPDLPEPEKEVPPRVRLQEKYKRLYGKEPDQRFGVNKLRRLIDEYYSFQREVEAS